MRRMSHIRQVDVPPPSVRQPPEELDQVVNRASSQVDETSKALFPKCTPKTTPATTPKDALANRTILDLESSKSEHKASKDKNKKKKNKRNSAVVVGKIIDINDGKQLVPYSVFRHDMNVMLSPTSPTSIPGVTALASTRVGSLLQSSRSPKKLAATTSREPLRDTKIEIAGGREVFSQSRSRAGRNRKIDGPGKKISAANDSWEHSRQAQLQGAQLEQETVTLRETMFDTEVHSFDYEKVARRAYETDIDCDEGPENDAGHSDINVTYDLIEGGFCPPPSASGLSVRSDACDARNSHDLLSETPVPPQIQEEDHEETRRDVTPNCLHYVEEPTNVEDAADQSERSRVIGGIAIAEYDGSPRRYRPRKTDALPSTNKHCSPQHRNSRTNQTSVANHSSTLSSGASSRSHSRKSSGIADSRPPGFPQRVLPPTVASSARPSGDIALTASQGSPSSSSSSESSSMRRKKITSTAALNPELNYQQQIDSVGDAEESNGKQLLERTAVKAREESRPLTPSFAAETVSEVLLKFDEITNACNSTHDEEAGLSKTFERRELLSQGAAASSQYDYQYEFSETRKVLDEFFKAQPVAVVNESKGEFGDDLNYTLLRRTDDQNSYIGQRLAENEILSAAAQTEDAPSVETAPIESDCSSFQREPFVGFTPNDDQPLVTIDSTEAAMVSSIKFMGNPSNFQSVMPSSASGGGCNGSSSGGGDTGYATLNSPEVARVANHSNPVGRMQHVIHQRELFVAAESRNYTLSPETTDCDSADLESEVSLNEGSFHSSDPRVHAAMPVLEDGLSSGHASDLEEDVIYASSGSVNPKTSQQQQLSMNSMNDLRTLTFESAKINVQLRQCNEKENDGSTTQPPRQNLHHSASASYANEATARNGCQQTDAVLQDHNTESPSNQRRVDRDDHAVTAVLNDIRQAMQSTCTNQQQTLDQVARIKPDATSAPTAAVPSASSTASVADDPWILRQQASSKRSPPPLIGNNFSLANVLDDAEEEDDEDDIDEEDEEEDDDEEEESESDHVEERVPTPRNAKEDDDLDTDQETDRLLGQQYSDDNGYFDAKSEAATKKGASTKTKEVVTDPKVLIEGVLFRARYLGSTQLVCEGQPTKATRMIQAEEAVSRIKAPEGETQPSTEVDLFISTEKIMVLNTDLKEIMMDHSLRSISYIADIGDLLVIMARRRLIPSNEGDEAAALGGHQVIGTAPKMICHVFESEEAQFIAQSIGQAFQVAYMEFLKANGIEDHSFVKEMDYQEVLNSQEIFGDELAMFAKKELQKEVVVPKAKGEILGVVIVESGWGSMLPTIVLANLSPTGPAARCGQLNIGDQIIAINGVSLVGLPLSTCQNYIKHTKNKTAVKLTAVSCAPVVEVKIKRPDTKYQLGFSVQNGVICSLLRGGIAERGGVRVGHRIIEINGQSVVAVPHERIVNLLATSVGEITMKTMPTSMFRLLTGQETPMYI